MSNSRIESMERTYPSYKWGIINYLGSNGEKDAYNALRYVSQRVEIIHGKDGTISNNLDAVILPGGFSYGDYLRAGAIAARQNISEQVRQFAESGKPIIGICNGFQILTEMRLLPGALLRNSVGEFRSINVYIKVVNNETPFTKNLKKNRIFKLPIAHGEGNFICDPDTLAEIEENRQVVFRYCTKEGKVTSDANPNGSLNNIAGIVDRTGKIIGMMPHPERAYEPILTSGDDGRYLLESFIRGLRK